MFCFALFVLLLLIFKGNGIMISVESVFDEGLNGHLTSC